MAFEKEHFGAGPTHGEVAHPHPRQMPSVLTAPDVVLRWRTLSLIAAVVLGVLSLAFLFVPGGRNHLLRAYLMGVMTCFNFTGGRWRSCWCSICPVVSGAMFFAGRWRR